MKVFCNILKIIPLILCCVLANTAFFSTKKIIYADTTFNVVAFGDSISAAYAPDADPYNSSVETTNETLLRKRQMLADYKAYCSAMYGFTVSKSAYSYIFPKQITKNAKVRSYANSGDTSSDLVDILTQDNFQKSLADSNKTVTILNDKVKTDIKNANLITLCIGANDILKPATSKLMTYNFAKLLQPLTEDEKSAFRAEIESGVNTFKENFANTIIPAINECPNVFVLTIYNPFQYLGILDNFAGLKDIINISMSGINEINDFIRSREINNITIIDVANNFSRITQSEYKNYVNFDISQLTSVDINDLQTQIQNGEIPYFLDPHPTPLGQQRIAEICNSEYTSKNTVPTTTIVFVSMLLTFAVIIALFTIYSVIQKIRYNAIKF